MEYYIDLGSSTIKVYEYDKELTLLEEHSIYFKNNFDKEKGISEENLQELCDYFTHLKETYNLKYENTHIYVTGIFRELTLSKKQELVKLFNDKFDLHFNIISHGIENYYLGKAMDNDYNGKKVLIINMGGKTTELVTFYQNKITDTKNLKLGVADLLNNFDKVNNPYSGNTIEEMENFIKEKCASLNLDTDYDCAIFTGGEERFELLTGFNLIENTLFHDNIHKYMLSLEDYIKGTEKVFYDISLEELYKLMPGNPKWMDGARSGAIIPLVLFKLANVNWIIPSDLNLINGVINDLQRTYFNMNTVSNYKKAVLCLKTLQNYFINYSQKIANVGYPNTILPKTNEWITYMFFSCLLNYGMRSETYHKNMIQAYLHHPELFQPNYVVKNFQKKENNLKILLCQNIHPRYPNIATKKWIKLSEELSKFDSLIYKISTLNSFEELYFFIQSFHCFGQKTGGLLIRVIIDSKVCKISDNEMNFIPLDRHDIEISYLNNIIDTNKPTKKKLHELSSTWIKAGKQLNLTPSEVDKYLWEVGNSFCGKKKCATCPLRKNCKKKERI